MDPVRTHRHPSYGMVQFNRRSSSMGTHLFGSSTTDHFHTVSLSVSEAEAHDDDLGEQRYRATKKIVEVELSAAQFAELLTTMNIGDGIPCTLTRRQGVGVIEEPPKPETTTERSHAAFEEKMRAFGKKVDRFVANVSSSTESIPKGKRDEIRKAAAMLAQEINSNIPFYLRLFVEAAEKIVTSKKAEADAWLTHAMNRAGLASLRSLAASGEMPAPELTAHEPEGDAHEHEPPAR